MEWSDGQKDWYLEGCYYGESSFKYLTEIGLVVGIEKGQYNLNWIKILTEKGIREFPIIHGMDFISVDNIR